MANQNETDAFFVAGDSKYYPGYELRIKRWMTEQEGIHNRTRSYIQIVDYRPEKSIKVAFTSGKRLAFWFPLSQCELVIKKQSDLTRWSL